MRIALVHDWLNGMRGGEKVLEAFCELFPQTEIYTLLCDPSKISAKILRQGVRTSWLQRIPGSLLYYRYLLPLMPRAIRSFDFSEYDLVLSISHCVAKGIKVDESKRRPLHICYCNTPMRYIYYQLDNYFPNKSRPWMRLGVEFFRPYLTRWDKKTTSGVHHFIANSNNVRERIQTTYGRSSDVIYPPVDVDYYTPSDAAPEPFFLIVGALVAYKRVDLAIQACARLKVPLKIVGVGTEEKALKELAEGSQVEFLGWQDQDAIRDLYRRCQALIYPQEEDFGITAVEAMACGRPVIAFRRGGALETVVDGVTGTFFDEQTPQSLAGAIERFRDLKFDPAAIRRNAQRFAHSEFKQQIKAFVRKKIEEERLHKAPERRIKVMQVIECGGAGGTGHQVAAVCSHLDRKLFDVSLAYSIRPDGGTRESYEAMVRRPTKFFFIPEMVREIRPLKDIVAGWKLYRIFRSEKPDVVHAHSSKAGFLARVAAKAAGVPRIYYSARGYSFLQSDRLPTTRLFYKILERIVSSIGDVVAISDSEADLARGLKAARVRVIRDAYLGQVPAARSAKVNGKKELVVCAAGRLTFPRNPEAFVRLAERVSKLRPQAKLVWIGDGELAPKVKRMIRRKGLEDRIELTGWLVHEKAMERLRGADVFVHFSRWEGLPNAVLEAMANGLPVVSSDIPGNRDVVRNGENGLLARTESELAEKTIALLDAAQERNRLGRNGWAMVEQEYSIDRMMREYTSLYAGYLPSAADGAI